MRLKWITSVLILSCLFFTLPAFSAISFDAASSATAEDVASRNWSHTCTACDIILIGIAARDSTLPAISSVTYNGQALTFIGTTNNSLVHAFLYYRVSPATGTNTASVTWAGTVLDFVVAAVTLKGVDTGSPIGQSGTNQAVASSLGASLSSIAEGTSWLAGVLSNINNDPLPSSPAVTRTEVEGFFNNWINMATQAAETDPDDLTWTQGSSQRMALVVVEIKAASTPTGRRRGIHLY